MELLRLAALTHCLPLSVKQLGEIAPYASELTIAPGQRVLLDGPFAQELVLVAAGRGRVRSAGEVVAELGPGDAFGALAPRRTAYATATVTAMSELTVVTFGARDLRLLRERAPEAATQLLAACAGAPQAAPAAPRLALVHSAAA